MDIIPVIDIRDGIVVHAQGGNRAHYQPLKSILTQSVILENVIGDLLDWYPFSQLYIADLDAIERGKHDPERYQNILRNFPELTIWLDAGISERHEYRTYPISPQLCLVIGSETLTDIQLLTEKIIRQRDVLSLDKKSGQILGHEVVCESEFWVERCIAMSLDHVGSNQGPDVEWLKSLLNIKDNVSWYAAGGVRDEDDLIKLSEIGVKGALVASALHTGRLSKSAVKRLSRDITLP